MKQRTSQYTFVSAGLLSCLIPLVSYAMPTTAMIDNHSVTVGVATQYASRYSGSNSESLAVLPIVQARNDEWFFDISKGLGLSYMAPSGWYWEQSIGYSLGRDEKNSSWRDGSNALENMGKITPAMTTSSLIGYQVMPGLWTDILVTKPINQSQGIAYSPAIDIAIPFTQSDIVMLHGRLLGGSHKYTQLFYGVSQNQSQQANFEQYQPSSGFYGNQVSLQWLHMMSTNLSLVLQVDYQHLSDTVADSPIVSKSDSLAGIVAATYTF